MTSDLWKKKPRNYQKGVVLFFRGKERKLKAETLNLGERITTLNSAVRKIVHVSFVWLVGKVGLET